MPVQTAKVPPPKKDYLLFAGRIEPAKGLYDLVVAYADYAGKSPKPLPLRIAGRVIHQSYYRQIMQLIHQKNLEGLIDILGERNDIHLLMQQARAIVIPSRFEGFGRCMAEAMFNGCLVIGRYTGGTKEQYDNGLQLEGDEIALKYETCSELSDCLYRVESGAEDFKPYIDRAFHAVNNLYSMETNTSNTLKFYQDILDNEHL
jgi:glycosyltransferase involved in cell wall biosynthesis